MHCQQDVGNDVSALHPSILGITSMKSGDLGYSELKLLYTLSGALRV